MKSFLDPFVVGLATMIGVAYLFPGLEHPLHLSTIIQAGVVLIFFFYGLKLNLSSLRSDLSNWHLHLGVQLVTYVLYPLVVLTLYPAAKGTEYYTFWLGLFYLASLPSTVSSSIVMVSIAKGNIPGAIFNASLSGLLGVVITPLLMGLFITSGGGQALDFGAVVLDLVLQILLPLAVGIALNGLLGPYIKRHSKSIAWFDKVVIWLIVYRSFSESFTSGIFERYGLTKVLALLLMVMVLFAVIYLVSDKAAKWLHFSIEDRITLSFCGTKKSLVHGSVMASVIFAGMQESGIYLLPILMYHPFQIFVISLIAQRFGRREGAL